MQKNFSDFYSIIQDQKNLLDEIKIIGSNTFEIGPILKQYKGKDFSNLYNIFLLDATKGKKDFNNLIKEQVRSGLGLLKDLNTHIDEKASEQEEAYRDLLNKKEELNNFWSNLSGEKEGLQNESRKMTLELNVFLKKRSWLVSKREYINHKYSEYGDDEKINELFQQWSEEYKNEKAEEMALKVEYEKVRQDGKTIPLVCKDIKNYIKSQKDGIALARYEMEEIFKAVPDFEERAKESEEIVLKYNAVHKNLEENTRSLNDLRDKFKKVDDEKKKLEINLEEKKTVLAPILKTEDSLKNKLAEITDRFDRQEELKEERRVLKEVIQPLERSIEGWKEKIKNFEKKSTEANKEIEKLKSESHKLVAELKEYEALAGPVMELKERMDSAEKENSMIDEQDKKLTREIHKMRKENELLSIKAKQFEMVKKKLGGVIK